MDNLKKRFKQGEKAVYFSLFGNFGLSALKFFFGMISGSYALLADGLHSLSDLLTTAIVWIGLKTAIKPSDKEHPFGHGDAESIAGLVLAVILAVVAFEFGRDLFFKRKRRKRRS